MYAFLNDDKTWSEWTGQDRPATVDVPDTKTVVTIPQFTVQQSGIIVLEHQADGIIPAHQDVENFKLSFQAVSSFSEDELKKYGLVVVVPTDIPEGKILVGYSIEDVAGVPTQVGKFDDAPPPEPAKTVEEKLHYLGLTLEELKAALQ